MRISSALLAISLLTASKEESLISLVSSISISTPASFSKVRMFLPPAPIILPLTSSLGTVTEETVYSAVYWVAPCFMASRRISLAVSAESSFIFSSAALIFLAISPVRSFWTSSRRALLASSAVILATLANFSTYSSLVVIFIGAKEDPALVKEGSEQRSK